MEPLDETTSLLPIPEQEEIGDLEVEYHKHNLALPKLPILTSLWLGSFISSLDGTVVANIMNRVAEEFAESDRKQWIATSFLLTNTAFQPLYGKLSDVTGRKFALLTAYTFFGLGCLLTCFARNVTEFAVARAICGIGGGGINACSSITVSDICTAKERGIYQGYANIVFGLGQMLGAPIGGLFIDTVGWRAIFGIQVPVILLSAILAFKNVNIKLSHVPPVRYRFTRKNLSRIDFLGSLTLALSICGLLLICSTDLNKKALAVLTGAAFALFLWVELCFATEAILPFKLLSGSFGLASVATVCSSFIIFGDIFRSPIYLQLIHDISVTQTGLFLIFPSIAVAAGSLAAGYVLRHSKMQLDRCAYLIVLFGIAFQLLGLTANYYLVSIVEPALSTHGEHSVAAAAVRFASQSFSWKILFVLDSVLVGFGYACLLVATLVSIVFSIEKSQQATMTGIFYLWRSIGNVLGASLTLVIFDKSLARSLWHYMFHSDGVSYDFTADEYYELLSDTSYLRSHFPPKILRGLLAVYRTAFQVSFWPNIGLAIAGLAASCFLIRTVPKTT
ncbi:hypothetical protein HG536_0A04040 [Torulaspora globosa]|uniref:Major facilitator superfamily (MFS) profile domain-containing protein n=1 Tax=Torulaspora globosa TaxID=48254 RepID=A0A7G3ZAQ0_9SACH|nr:uncharacterized protein HG536_0A04040 [Torulaspora globosa]QLL30586.1 hypothetical protein HG536_0A04040 [Torulaspora globosa]